MCRRLDSLLMNEAALECGKYQGRCQSLRWQGPFSKVRRFFLQHLNTCSNMEKLHGCCSSKRSLRIRRGLCSKDSCSAVTESVSRKDMCLERRFAEKRSTHSDDHLASQQSSNDLLDDFVQTVQLLVLTLLKIPSYVFKHRIGRGFRVMYLDIERVCSFLYACGRVISGIALRTINVLNSDERVVARVMIRELDDGSPAEINFRLKFIQTS